MNDLAIFVEEYITSKGIMKTWIATQLGMSQQLLYRLMHKKNFSIDDANRILSVIGYQIEYDIVPLDPK